MSGWIIVAIAAGGAVSAVMAYLTWREWLRFAARIAERHGVEHLSLLPPLAESFRQRLWGLGPRRRNPDPAEEEA